MKNKTKKAKTEKSKHIKALIFLILNTIAIIVCTTFAVLSWTVFRNYIPDSVAGVALSIAGFLLPIEKDLYENFNDAMPWQAYLRYLLRKKEINKNTLIRTNYVAFMIVEVDNKYLVLKNTHGMGLFQLPAKAYRMSYEKRMYLEKKFNTSPDDYITGKSYYDYRFLVKAKDLKKFYNHFLTDINPLTYDYSIIVQKMVDKCGLDNELFKNGKVAFKERQIERIQYSRYTSHYEMMVCDVTLFEPTEEQYNALMAVVNEETDDFKFVTLKELKSNGVDAEAGKRLADIIPGAYDLVTLVKGKEE